MGTVKKESTFTWKQFRSINPEIFPPKGSVRIIFLTEYLPYFARKVIENMCSKKVCCNSAIFATKSPLA